MLTVKWEQTKLKLKQSTGNNLLLQQMKELILATDMARHSEIIAQFNTFVDQGFNYADSDHLDLVKS